MRRYVEAALRHGIFVGGVMHVVGVTAAIAGGLAMVLNRERTAAGER